LRFALFDKKQNLTAVIIRCRTNIDKLFRHENSAVNVFFEDKASVAKAKRPNGFQTFKSVSALKGFELTNTTLAVIKALPFNNYLPGYFLPYLIQKSVIAIKLNQTCQT
jgi:hypothetical protein